MRTDFHLAPSFRGNVTNGPFANTTDSVSNFSFSGTWASTRTAVEELGTVEVADVRGAIASDVSEVDEPGFRKQSERASSVSLYTVSFISTG